MKTPAARRTAVPALDATSSLTAWIAVAIAVVMTIASLFAAALA